jgi:dihydrofolate synthase/folylpolyglutamate synthase
MIIEKDFFLFLEKKTLYYDKIDYDIIAQSWKLLSSYITLPYIIHIIGTNGKGSTGRYIASFIKQNNKNVIHYSSPHILEFNERIWIDGKNSTNTQLQDTHNQIIQILPNDLLNQLTYFEYTTLICLYLSSHKDYLVLEAGLGGEFDATNVVKNNLTVVPSIGLDHIEFLGDTIQKIATTKLKSCDENYIFGLDMDKNVKEIQNDILKDKTEIKIDKNLTLNRTQNLPKFLKNNLTLALNVVKYLKLDIKNLQNIELFARCQKIKSNITIDVGHNLLAANVIKDEFKNQKITLIYNSYKDKDYNSILNTLHSIIDTIEVIECKDTRICDYNQLKTVANKLNLPITKFKYSTLNKEKNYLVFGSFVVVESFLKRISKFQPI